VLVELDGKRWRTLPLEVAARTPLSVGVELDRERLRVLRRELRRTEALAAGARALSHRDRSEQGLRRALDRKGVTEEHREEAVRTLKRLGAVNDERFARARAASLAERGWGNAAIASALELENVGGELASLALAELEPERDRAARFAARRGGGERAARWLATRGFERDAIEVVVPGIAESEGAELG
jgi:SOS response regulatory protein OraA/RecX